MGEAGLLINSFLILFLPDCRLQMKAMNIDKVVNFPFPTPPDQQAMVSAEKLLVLLGALDRTSKKITTLGRAMVSGQIATDDSASDRN